LGVVQLRVSCIDANFILPSEKWFGWKAHFHFIKRRQANADEKSDQFLKLQIWRHFFQIICGNEEFEQNSDSLFIGLYYQCVRRTSELWVA